MVDPVRSSSGLLHSRFRSVQAHSPPPGKEQATDRTNTRINAEKNQRVERKEPDKKEIRKSSIRLPNRKIHRKNIQPVQAHKTSIPKTGRRMDKNRLSSLQPDRIHVLRNAKKERPVLTRRSRDEDHMAPFQHTQVRTRQDRWRNRCGRMGRINRSSLRQIRQRTTIEKIINDQKRKKDPVRRWPNLVKAVGCNPTIEGSNPFLRFLQKIVKQRKKRGHHDSQLDRHSIDRGTKHSRTCANNIRHRRNIPDIRIRSAI